MALVKYNNNSISAVTSASSIPSGALTHIKTLTASSSATLSFVDGSDGVVLDSTYPIYKFEFINMHPATNNVTFGFQANASGGSGYNETITSTFFSAYHNEADSAAALVYDTGADQAQGTSFQALNSGIGNDNDQCKVGYLHLFNPSSTTFVKHFISVSNNYVHSDYSQNDFIAGYFNTTSAIDEIQFKMSSGNIDSGKIKLYGIKDS
jgi:hypothetical protein